MSGPTAPGLQAILGMELLMVPFDGAQGKLASDERMPLHGYRPLTLSQSKGEGPRVVRHV